MGRSVCCKKFSSTRGKCQVLEKHPLKNFLRIWPGGAFRGAAPSGTDALYGAPICNF